MMRRDQEDEKKRSVIAEFKSRADESFNAGDLKKAVEKYRTAYKIAREIGDDKIERTCALNLGAACIGADEPKEGLVYLHKATPPDNERDEPSNGALFFNKGLAFEKMGDTKNALEQFSNAYEEYKDYERYNTAVIIHCLEKCLKIYENQKQHMKAAGICKDLAGVYDGLSKASNLCKRVTYLRLGNCKEDSWKEAYELLQSVDDMKLEGGDCLLAGKILNDLGLAFTLVHKYADATDCFEKALHKIKCSHIPQDQLEAVVLQNLGAAYNFMGDFLRAVKFHEDAIKKYGKSKNRNSQGQCFTNLAYAFTQCSNFREAELAFHHALLAAKDSSDQHMEWQALEGLGAVNFSQGNFELAVEFYMRALQTVGSQEPASERIKNKLLQATQQLHGGRVTPRPRVPETANALHLQVTNKTALFEEHAQVVPTPRETYDATFVEETFEAPAMASLQEEPVPKRGFLPVRKRGSVGPHTPKISRGLASSLGYYDSPRIPLHSAQQTMLEEESESDGSETSETDDSSSDDSSEESDINHDVESQNLSPSRKVDEIFRKPNTTLRETMDEADQLHSQYQAHLQDKENNEVSNDDDDDDDDDDSSKDSSSSDSSEDSDDDDDMQSTPVQQTTHAPPPLPTQSPPNTALLSQGQSGTYLQPRIVHTTADVHESVSSSRVARQQDSQETSGGSPRGGAGNADEETERKDLYATVSKTQQLQSRQGQTDAGNVNTVATGSRRRISSSDGRKGENFFDSENSSLHSNRQMEDTGADEEDPYHSLDFEREDEAGGIVNQEVDRIDNLPRGQKEQILAQYHQKHEMRPSEGQDPPPLPQREDKSKTCNIM